MNLKIIVPFLLLLSVCIFVKAQSLPGSATPFPNTTLVPRKTEIKLSDLPKPYVTESSVKPPQHIERPSGAALAVPPGFSVNIFAETIKNARWMALAPNGDVFLVQSRENKITVLRDKDGDGLAEYSFTYAAGEPDSLNQPMGIAFRENFLYVANTSGVIRFPYRMGDTITCAPPQSFIPGITPGGYNQHWTRNILFHDNRVYLTIGSATNVDPEELPRASIQVYDLQGKNQGTFAHGFRNPVGMAINPVTNQLWATVTERDWLGDDLVPDFFTSVQEGGFYGWPYVYLAPHLPDPRRTEPAPDMVQHTISPEIIFQAHSVPLGLVFYTGRQFPKKYRNGAFVSFRGSSNRKEGTGYKIVFIPFDKKGKPVGGYEDFLSGWLHDKAIPSTWGRPVGLLQLPDGSLLIADETGGVIWRVSYHGK